MRTFWQVSVPGSVKPRRGKTGGSIAEFPIVLIVLLLFIAFPLIDCLSLAVSAASIGLLSQQAASRAASQQNYSDALSCMQEDAISFMANGFASLNKMQPVGGYQNCGLTLYTVATDFHSNKVSTYGPNTPLAAPPQILDDIYEFDCKAEYRVGPFISLALVPGFDKVPGLGCPAVLTFNSQRSLEHPEGLFTTTITVGAVAAGAHAPPLVAKVGSGSTSVPADGTWNYPNLYQVIAASGKKIVSEDVLVVDSLNPNWTISAAMCASGEQVWIDTHADGAWTPEISTPGMVDANGMSTSQLQAYDPNTGTVGQGWQIGALVSQVGNNGPVFEAGDTLLNYQAPSAGPVEFKMNDYPNEYPDNSGTMTVRVIVTQ